ncbi:L,D-transpeptidase, partial [Amycolatopsis rhizosphaerae]|uniref:L,D-transpeptidase n=1 Tax=Amycolatopsis rhizosphaerae TaxID=2053003 RepID=UPI001FE3FE9C
PSTTTTKKPTSAPKTTTAAPATDPSVPCTITEGACVDISAKKAWLLAGGKVVYGPVPVTTGRPGYPTPTGKFQVISKEKMHYSTEFNNAPMPNSVFFVPGDAFHTGSLSTPSHGCVHLSSAASLKFFNTLSVGDPVQVVP